MPLPEKRIAHEIKKTETKRTMTNIFNNTTNPFRDNFDNSLLLIHLIDDHYWFQGDIVMWQPLFISYLRVEYLAIDNLKLLK